MAEPLTCPHCHAILTDEELRSLQGRYRNSKRKTFAGGRPKGRKEPERPREYRLVPVEEA